MERPALARHSALIPSFNKHWLTSYLRPGAGAGHGRPGCVGPSPAPRAVPWAGKEQVLTSPVLGAVGGAGQRVPEGFLAEVTLSGDLKDW